jgi:hypothetical protein
MTSVPASTGGSAGADPARAQPRAAAMHRELSRARAVLAAAVATRSILLGAAAYAGVLLLIGAADWLFELPAGWRRVGALAAAAVGIATTIWMGVRSRDVRRLESVALWLEGAIPSLRYRLVTAVDPDTPARERRELVRSLGEQSFSGVAWRRAFRGLAGPVAGAAVAFLALLAITGGSVARVVAPGLEGPSGLRPSRLAAGELGRVVVEVAPPSYARLETRTLEDPSVIQALPGSRLRVRAGAGGVAIRATLADVAVASTVSRHEHVFQLTVSSKPAAIVLETDVDRRLILLEPSADEPPSVRLTMPERDSVLREPRGELRLEAHAADDYGLSDGGFEWILSSGEGEIYTFRSGLVGAWRGDGKETPFSARLSLDSLRMGPGDVLHLRAVARDRNDVTGPSSGSSETRAFRVPRRGEYDSVAVEAAPPGDVDRSALSQRMLIQLAEALESRRPRLGRPTLLRESARISADQKRLRRSVGDVIFMRLGGEASGEHSHDDGHDHGDSPEELLELAREASERDPEAVLDFEGDETPVVAINRPLLQAYNSMWAASMELDQGSPASALPHMRAALDALQQARLAERVYLRGLPPAVVIDLARIRLQGAARGSPSTRQPPEPQGRGLVERLSRLERVIILAGEDAGAAADSLLLLRIDLLAESPAAADALGEAAAALRRGRAADVERSLIRARNAITGKAVRAPGLSQWLGGGLP